MMTESLYSDVLLTFLVLLFLLVVFFPHELKQQLEFQLKQDLAEKASKLRIFQMLKSIGLTISSYTGKASRRDMARHIANCQACENTQACDNYLGNPHSVNKVTFCPNYHSLRAIKVKRTSKLL